MTDFNRLKSPGAMVFALLFAGCATTTSQYVSTYQSSGKSPTETINAFAYEGQRRELAQIIEETPEQKPVFLKDVDNKKVDFWVNYFSKRDKARFERFLKNGAKYRATIQKIFDDYGLPQELFYVGLIESGYYLGAKSHAGAVGPWQFVRATAKRYGLNVQKGLDERRSIVKSTQAAALYFQDLYNIFGNWELALSAYNAGEYGVVRRIRKAKTRDYYELSAKKVLPKETRHYVPKVLAAMKIMENPLRYNIRVPKIKEDLYENIKEVTLKNSVDINTLARKTGVSKAVIQKLNPDLLWRSIPRVRKGYNLYLPTKSTKIIESINESSRNVASNDEGATYKVRRGDNLISIAKRYNISLRDLMKENNIRRSNHIRIGQTLSIPGVGEVDPTETYRVKRGDNLYELARRYHTSISKILKLNKLSKRTIYVGQRLQVPRIEKSFYTVRPGDYLLKIAKKHGTTVSELKKLNSINSKIYPGQKLVVNIN